MNTNTDFPSNPPFWVDTSQARGFKPTNNSPRLRLLKIAINIFIYAQAIYVLLIPLLVIQSTFFTICWFTIILVLFAYTYFMQRKMKSNYQKAREIQENAKQSSGASSIASAIHVAGHPSLERDQPIVLAITDDSLDFYSFNSSAALVSLKIDDIHAVSTVVYDDERVPHAEVIDSAAQALQIEFNWKGQVCTLLLRAMKQIRPIDWYHAIQQARFSQQD